MSTVPYFLSHGNINTTPGVMSSFIEPMGTQSLQTFKKSIEQLHSKSSARGISLLDLGNKSIMSSIGSLTSIVPKRLKATSNFNHIEEMQDNERRESPSPLNLRGRVAALNLQTITSLDDISSMESVIEEMQSNETVVEAFIPLEAAVPLEFASNRLASLEYQPPASIPTNANIPINNPRPSSNTPVQSSGREKLISWILTSHNVYGFTLTVLHNFLDICLQKPEDKNFINDSLVPRIRYTGFTISATAGAVYHVAMGVLFTPFVAITLGQKESVNDMWYGCWAGACISAMGVFAGIFGMVSGNYLIHKTMEKSVPQFKKLLNRYLWKVQIFCRRLNTVNFSELRQEVKDVKNTAEMVVIVRKLVGIVKDILPAMAWQNAVSFGTL